MIDCCSEKGLFFRTRKLDTFSYVFVLEKIKDNKEVEELEELFGLTEFDEGVLEEERVFDIIDRLYTLLIRKWEDWTIG